MTEIVTQLLGSFRSTRTVVIGAAFLKKISFSSKIISHFCWILVPKGVCRVAGTYVPHRKVLFTVPCPPTRSLEVRDKRTAKRDDTKSMQVEETHHPEMLSPKWPSFGRYNSADLLLFLDFTRKQAASSFGQRQLAKDGSGGATIAAP